MKKLISIVIPSYNEKDNLDELQLQLARVMGGLSNYSFEVIVVENGSSDGSWEKLKEMSAKDPRFKSVQLSRNFTAPGGITAGFNYASGDAAVVMCADLQDPPEMLPRFLEKWEEGYDIVYHLVSKRKGAGLIRAAMSEVFHWGLDKLTGGNIPRNGSVYRLMDRSAYEAFNNLSETNRYFPGLCSWIGFQSIGIKFERAERFAGDAKSPFSVVFKLALNGIFSFSNAPLRMVTYFGLFIASLSLVYFTYLVATVFLDGAKTIPGLATLICLTLFLFGALFLSVGIVGEYLARIYDEVKGRPNFIVKSSVGFGAVQERGVASSALGDTIPVVYGKLNGDLIQLDGPYEFKNQKSITVRLN